jgi:hypothetical protein
MCAQDMPPTPRHGQTSPTTLPTIACAVSSCSCCVASRFELLYCDYNRRDLGLDLSQHPLTRPAAAALAHCRRAALGTAPSCFITSSPMAWNAYETNVLTNPSLYRQKGDALVRHGCLATLSPLCVPITRNRLYTSMNASVTTGKSYYVLPIHIA